MASKSKFTGAQIDEALAKILNIEITENGCIRLPSTEDNPVNLDTCISPGFYEIDYYTSSRSIPFTEHPITLTVMQFTDPNSGNAKYSQVVSFIGSSYWRSMNRSDPSAPVYTDWEMNAGERQMLISKADPDVNAHPLYTPYINIAKPAPYIKILIEDKSGATPVRKWVEMIPGSVLSKAVYDPQNMQTDIFKYVDDVIADADIGTITTDFTTHINDTTIHVTQAERDTWAAKVSQENLAATLQTILTYVETQVTAAASNLEGDATANATKLTELNTKLDTHAADTTVHPSAAKMAEWDSKANGDHTHLSDSRVEIDATKVVSGTLNPARIPDKAYMKIVSVEDNIERKSLTNASVQNGDTVYEQYASYNQRVAPIIPSTLNSITYANNLYISAGYDGTILTSPDKINWTKRSSDTDDNLYNAAYGNNIFVVVGYNGTILTSPDGVTWTKSISPSSANLCGVAYGNNIFVIAGYQTILTSPDGITWTDRSSVLYRSDFRDIIYVNNQFIIVGGDILTSPNGITWTKQTNSSSTILWDITYGKNMYVAVSSSKFISSPDGITWTVGNDVVGISNIETVVYANNQFVAITANCAIATSPDGITWTKDQDLVHDFFMRDCIYVNNQFIVVGDTGSILVGDNYTSLRHVGLNTPIDPECYDIAYINYTNGRYLALTARSNVILESSDGFNWRKKSMISITNEKITAVTYGKSEYIAVGYNGTIVASSDLITWTLRTSGVTTNLFNIMHTGNGYYIVIGSNGTIITSNNGIQWSTPEEGVGSNDLYDIAYNYNHFAIIGDSGTILSSPKTYDWVKRTNADTNNLNSIAYGSNITVAVGDGGVILTSPDTITWTQRTSGTSYSLRSITWGKDMHGGYQFVVVGERNTILTSPDGITWTKINSPIDNSWFEFSCIASNNSQFVATGTTGTIIALGTQQSDSFYYVIDDTKLTSDEGWLLYSSTQVMELVWEKITGRPTTLAGYGITDAFTKSELDVIIKGDLTDPLDALQTKIDTMTTKVDKLATYTDNTDIAALLSEMKSIGSDLDQVKAQHAQILASVTSIDSNVTALKALI